jgi:protein SCO1/2
MKGHTLRSAALSRRHVLVAGVAGSCMAWPQRRAAAHALYGPVTPPVQPPAIRLTTAQGHTVALQNLLKGHITAVQLMFTGCTATCPIQGAIFAEAASQLATAASELRLLSISIDPLGDDTRALTAWLHRYGAQPPRWGAAVPLVKDVDKLLDFLRGRASGVDRHTAQAFLFDRQARLAFRTTDMPAGGDLAALMRQLADLR